MVIWCFYKIGEIGSPGWFVITLGIVKGREDVKELIDKVLMYPRVSSQDQEEGTSLAKQNDALYGEAEAVVDENDIIVIGNEWESAATMLRDNIDEIIDKVTNSEERYCLMFRNVDRLSRADPFEAATFCWIMKQNDVILYFDDLGYFDFSDLMQEMIIMMQLVQSREEYNKIRKRGSEGRKEVKEKGAYPAKAPFGFDKDDDNVLVVNEDEAEIIRRGAELAIEGDEELGVEAGNVRNVHDRLEKEYSDEYVPAYGCCLHRWWKQRYTLASSV
ncbi:MAG: recombinase family protein, partial [Halobacteriaceae archaeon]